MNGVHAHPLPFGAEVRADGKTRFRLWAPAQQRVHVELPDQALVQMTPAGDGWFEALVDCGTGTAYGFQLEDGRFVPDPASRAQCEDVHGYSRVIDPKAYRWRTATWRGRPWQETVLYEVHVGCAGGFARLKQQLPMLAETGITAIELMPIADFPGARNWGYDGVLPFAPDTAYGTPEQLKSLIDRAHELDLMVFLDVVYNHFGPDGNYLGAYAPQFFREDIQTLWGAAIDFRRPQVREFFTSNVLYWLIEYRFDGLRFDAVQAIEDPDWLDETAARVRDAIEPGRHVHLVLENDDNAARYLHRTPTAGFDAQWNDDFHHAMHVLLTGERDGYYANFADAPATHLARCLAEGFAYQGEVSPTHDRPRGTPSADLPPHAFVSFLQNHDQIGNRAMGERLITLTGPSDALRAARLLHLLMPQIPMLFMGEEWGCTAPFQYFTSHEPELAALVRDGRRREFARFPAFSDAQRRAAIPDPNALSTYERSCPDLSQAETPEAQAYRGELRKLLRLRKTLITPFLQRARSLGAQVLSDAAVSARWRLDNGRELTIAINLGSTPASFVAPPGLIASSLESWNPGNDLLAAACAAAFLTPESTNA